MKKELNHKELISEIQELAEKHGIIKLSYIGKSILNKDIPIITLGENTAKTSVMYVSTHHASENICTSVLLDFIKDYIEAYYGYGQVCSVNVKYLYKLRKIYIVPMLNPDGVDYRLNGIDKENPIRDRVIAYNKGEDFTKWNANARGVDLNHNYNAYFEEYKIYEKANNITAGKTKFSGEYAESEPEVQSLANFIRYFADEINGILTLHTQGEEIYYKSRGKEAHNTQTVSRHVSRMCNYPLCDTNGSASYGGLTDWYIKEFNKPSYTIECGRGENPLDISQAGAIYARLRELFFTFPILF